MAEQTLRVEEDRGIYRLTMDHGANALDPTLMAALCSALERTAAASNAPVLLVSSHGGLFSPGWDLKHLAFAEREEVRGFLELFNRLILCLFSHPGPTAVAIDGHAVAGGCLLAVGCDLRVMAAGRPRIGLSEVNLGVPVPAPCVRMLRARLAPHVVEELMFGGDGCTAERALELGLVGKVAPAGQAVTVAEKELRTLAGKPRQAYVESKRFLFGEVWRLLDDTLTQEDDVFLDSWFQGDTRARMQHLARRLSR